MNRWTMLAAIVLLLPAMLLACTAPEPPPAPEPAAVVDFPIAPEPMPAAVNHAPAATAAENYRAVERAEARAVTKPSATADSIGGVHRADREARRALAALVRQNGKPTPAAIARARQTLEALIHALEAPP